MDVKLYKSYTCDALQKITLICPTLVAMKTTPFTCLQNEARDFHAAASTTALPLPLEFKNRVFASETVDGSTNYSFQTTYSHHFHRNAALTFEY
jgi:hypothetical protein